MGRGREQRRADGQGQQAEHQGQQRAERGSVHEGVKTNPDGSTPIFIGPKAPKGWENNWIKSMSGRAWFPYFRFYGPLEPFYDKSWRMNDVVKTT